MAGPHPGKWEIVEPNAQVNATHAILLHTGRVLYFRSGYPPRPDGTSESRVWDPATGVISTQIIPKWPADPNDIDPPLLFCSGHCALPDGKILVAGGHRQLLQEEANGEFRGLQYTYIFDPVSEAWAPTGTQQTPHPMADGRWYPTVTALGEPRNDPTRRAIAMSGYRREFSGGHSVTNDDPETYSLLPPPGGGWSKMPDPNAAKQPFPDLYPGAHVVPRGAYARKIFYSMPMLQAYIFDPFADVGQPVWTPIASPRSQHRNLGSSVLLPIRSGNNEAKVLIIGGANPAVSTMEIIDLNDPSGPSWQAKESMFFVRRNCDAVLLPDGKILIVGGHRYSDPNTGQHLDPYNTAELFDPATEKLTSLCEMSIPRIYHSTAVLLPDGRVWASGGEIPVGYTGSTQNIEIFSPGYLFEGERPVIQSAPANISYGSSFGINTSLPVSSAVLLRPCSVTHAMDMEQRYVELSIQPGHINGYAYNVQAPADANIAPPGYYMLFVLGLKNASTSGQTAIPSVAKWVKLS